jgi:ATP-dependent Lhr-like helicase
MKDALTEAMDADGLKRVLERILDGSIRCVSVDTPVPSQFSHEILNANPYAYLDDAPLEERRARAVEMRRSLPETVVADMGRLDPAAIAEVRAEVWPDVRNAEELHDVLESLVALPDAGAVGAYGPWPANDADEDSPDFAYLGNSIRESLAAWREYLDELVAQQRIGLAEVSGRSYWVTAEKAKTVSQIFPEIRFTTAPAVVAGVAPSKEDALRAPFEPAAFRDCLASPWAKSTKRCCGLRRAARSCGDSFRHWARAKPSGATAGCWRASIV